MNKFLPAPWVILLLIVLKPGLTPAQESIAYTNMYTAKDITVGFGSYGRIGTSWTFEESSIEGRRLNLNNMGSSGGRMEEQDYLELGMAFHMRPPQLIKDSTTVSIQFRANIFSRSLSLFGNSNTASEGGLTIGLPEMYLEARNILTKDLNIWVGARLYRGGDVHMADYFYFNDHSGQGFGIEYKATRFHVNFISSTDTTATVPPFFFLNINSGTPSLELRRRIVYTLEKDFRTGRNQLLTALGEFHRIGDPSRNNDPSDSTNLLLSFPGDVGWVLGLKYQHNDFAFLPGSFHQIGVRYGIGIANGGDGGSSRTWETFGAPNLETNEFNSAYSWHVVDHFLLNFSPKFSLNGYAVYNESRGAADTRDIAETYFGREVFNSKRDFTIGFRGIRFITDAFHLQGEINYSQRQDGTQPWYRMTKLSIVPLLALKGERSIWSRPQIRFVYSVARYNDFAAEQRYSPFLDLLGSQRWGNYFGIKAEWWTW
ncbi:MAG: carbohydrate porin [Cyclobacteriaceae bacterium]